MHSFWLFFLRKREFSVLLMFALCALGIYAVILIPKESAPEVIVPIGIVTTVYPGASANDIEELITNKLEDAIENIDDLESLTSTSRDDVSSITAEFNAKADIDKSIQSLKNAIDSAKNKLPRDANDPLVTAVNFADQPVLVLSISSDLSPAELTTLGEALQTEFASVRGVAKVVVTGTRDRQIQVILKEAQLHAYNLSAREVTQALSLSNLSIPVGIISTAGIEYAIRFEGKLLTSQDIERLPVGTFAGMPVYVRDVATVNDGVARESSISRVSVNGAPSESAITLSIFKKSGFDVTTATDGSFAKLSELKVSSGLLADSQILTVFDLGEQVRNDLFELVKAGLETVALVVLCLLLTIGWRESVVAALSIPLSFVIAFIGLYLSGNTINFVSLFALILAVGILVDSGIVVTEAIHTRLHKYGNAEDAVNKSIHEYAWPLIAGTMTTVAVFAPLFFLSGITGKFIASIPFTIIFVLLASIFVALGLVPLIAIYLTNHGSSTSFEERQELYTFRAQAWYRKKLIAFLQNRTQQRILLWSLALGLLLAFMLPATGLLKVIFFPTEDVEYVFVEVETKQGTPVTETDLVVRAIEEVLYEKEYVEAFASTAGSGSAFTGSTDTGGKFANITVTLRKDRDQSSADVSTDLRAALAEIPGAIISISELQNGPPTGAPISLKFTGDNLNALSLAADSAEKLLAEITGTRDIEASTKSNATEFVLTIDKAKASALGISPVAIGELLRTTVFGVNATTISRDGKDIDVVVKLAIDRDTFDPSAIPQISLEAIKTLEVKTSTGEYIPLSNVMTESLAPANATIMHEDKQRLVTVSAFTTESVTASEVVAKFKLQEAKLELPSGVAISYGGETEDVNQSFTEMFVALIVGLLLMLSILVLQFNSIRYSLYLLLAVPYSLIGVFFGLAATGLALSFTSLLGVIALSGVIINHAIILMDSMITHKASIGSKSLLDNVADAAVSRFRPIMLTTITTVVGMIPLSRISDFWSPLAFSIMFGLSFAMILTLILVPTLYYRSELAKLEPKRPARVVTITKMLLHWITKN